MAGVDNPFFSDLPFNPDKGELLLVKIPNMNLTSIFKNKISIVPLQDTADGTQDMYWVGATNDWIFENAEPSIENKQLIINELEDILNIPFEVVAHHAAIRPTVKDRRPFIGFHPTFKNVGIFNGFGTKGASLVPFWAHHFADVLTADVPLENDVNISRFSRSSAVPTNKF